MSSSPRNVQIKPRFNSYNEESNWWDDLPAVLHCPECGKKAMRRVNGPCQLLDGILIPELERFQCSSCKANFFDYAAMKIMDKFRESLVQNSARPRRRTRVKRTLVDQ